jgi:hypothetical protein
VSAIHREDPLFKAIAGLPPVEPNAQHAEHVRERCRAALEQPPKPLPIALEPATVGAVCGAYAWQIVKIVERIGLP